MTFARACEQAQNFTAGHETRVRELGDDRLDYPDNHIEVDNRLSWFLGRLDEKYGDDAVYVYLKRDPLLIAESYNKRWHLTHGIVSSYMRGILFGLTPNFETSIDYVRTVDENIQHFLKDKTNIFHVDIAKPEQDFRAFWKHIKAEGDLEKAVSEFNRRHNTNAFDDRSDKPATFANADEKRLFEMQRVLRMFENERVDLMRDRRRLNAFERESGAKVEKLIAKIETLREREAKVSGQYERIIQNLEAEKTHVTQHSIESDENFTAKLNEANQKLKAAEKQTAAVEAKYRRRLAQTRNELKNVRASLGTQVGVAVVDNIRSPLGWIKMPFAMAAIGRRHRKNKSGSKPERADSEPDLKSKVAPQTPPPKNSKHAVWTAAQLIEKEGADAAYEYVRSNGDDVALNAARLFLANRDIESDEKWLDHVNGYLSRFKLAPLALTNSDRPRFYRLSCEPGYSVDQGPLISVIMPAFNAAAHIEHSVRSILQQTWRNLELIVVDDASDDETSDILARLAAADKRLRYIKNGVNYGPYVSKNRALDLANGEYVTGHDADDWAHPQRLENHFKTLSSDRAIVGVSRMLRVDKNGAFTQFMRLGKTSPDGALRLASISMFFHLPTFRTKFGYWDNVRFAADSELIERIRNSYGDDFHTFDTVSMFCLDAAGSLTNHPTLGVDPARGISPVRKAYRESWANWHGELKGQPFRLPSPHYPRQFEAPAEVLSEPLLSKELQARRERWAVSGNKQIELLRSLSTKRGGQNFAKAANIHVPELIETFEGLNAIPDLSALPASVVLKPDSGYSNIGVFVLDDGKNVFDNEVYDRDRLLASIKDIWSKKFPERDVNSNLFIAEERLRNWDGKGGLPYDYKFYMFADRIAFIHVVERNHGPGNAANRHWFLKEDWTPLDMQVQKTQRTEPETLAKPDCLDELIDAAKLLGEQVGVFMRIDLYATDRGPVFGEFTPFPHEGSGYTLEADRWLGALWKGLEGGGR